MPRKKDFSRVPDFCLTEYGQRLVAENRGLCGRIAGSFLGRGLSFEELTSAGFEGLCHAVARYRPDPGWRISTFATHWIRRFILDELWDCRAIRLPKMRPTKRALHEHYERMRSSRTVQVCEAIATRADEGELVDEEIAALRRAIEMLPGRYREVMERRLAGETLIEIARPLGISRKAIEATERSAKTMLRRSLGQTGRARGPSSWLGALG